MEFKRKQKVLRQKFGFRVIVCIAALVVSGLYLKQNSDLPIWGVVIGVCGSAFAWSIVEIFDFIINTFFQYENERNDFFKFTTNYWGKIKNVIRSDKENIPTHEIKKIVDEFYDELNSFIFSSNVYAISYEFHQCANYIERTFWKFYACCWGTNENLPKDSECYQELYDCLILIKEEQERTSGRLFDSMSFDQTISEMTNIELSFEKYQIPDNILEEGVIGNIGESFTIPGNVYKTITFRPDLSFYELNTNGNSNALFTVLHLIFIKIDRK